jgi:hypothetical protein
MAGRPPKPTNLLELTGAFKKNPKRLAERAGEPVPHGPLGPTPRHWWVKREDAAYERYHALSKLWREVSKLAPWLTSGDRFAVEQFCELLLMARQGTINVGERMIMKSIGSACGLDPSGRVKIRTAAPDKKAGEVVDPRDAFEKRG